MNKIYERLIELQKIHENTASLYEAIGSYEMAYLSLWIILEKILKEIDFDLRRASLYDQVCLWKVYLEDISGTKKPKEIKLVKLKESESIPDIEKIEKHLGKMPTVKQIMNTQAKNGTLKWRNKRNNIAHNAESFGKKETYEKYRNKIMDGVLEIKKLLQVPKVEY